MVIRGSVDQEGSLLFCKSEDLRVNHLQDRHKDVWGLGNVDQPKLAEAHPIFQPLAVRLPWFDLWTRPDGPGDDADPM